MIDFLNHNSLLNKIISFRAENDKKMKIETKYLKKLKFSRELVDIYTDRYDETEFGFIIDFNDDYLVIESIDDESNPNGISIFNRENITRIRWGGNQIESTQKLIDQSKRLKDIKKIDLTSIQTILKSVQNIFGYVCVFIEDLDSGVCFIGEIEEMDDETIIIYEYGTKTSLDRKRIMLNIDDITKVEGGGNYEESIKKLIKKEV